MLKKKLLTVYLATIISIGTVTSFNPAKVSAVDPSDFGGVIVDVGNKFIIPHLHQLANRDQANGGSDVEFKYFIPPKFEEGKFCISAFNYFNPKGTDTIYTVKVYPKNNPKNPSVYNLKSGDMLELNTGLDTPEYILEFYKPGETTPFGNYYLSNKFKSNYGIALAQNNNVYYLQKETGKVYNEEMIEFYSNGKYNRGSFYLASRIDDFVNEILRLRPEVRNQLFRQSKEIYKGNMSLPEVTENSDVENLLKAWKDNNPPENFLKMAEAVSASLSILGIPNLMYMQPRVITANADVTIGKNNAYYVDSSTIGIKPSGYLTYKIPVVESGIYKVTGNVEGIGHLICKSKDPSTGKPIEYNVDDSFTNDLGIYVWLNKGINEFKLINDRQSDIKFKSMTIQYSHR
ncbi:hypothetical protein [Clostridium sp. Marseille-Q2269]|uniref:hypothetical protein n=1 Tax=Clostridium sp. Marseille-Q2269 TaxID=2942205 RepID=UPI002072F3DB|nr:hypothetical protein [Clostridium sp. Marseille-Q2269]